MNIPPPQGSRGRHNSLSHWQRNERFAFYYYHASTVNQHQCILTAKKIPNSALNTRCHLPQLDRGVSLHSTRASTTTVLDQGRSDGDGYRYLYPTKSAQVNFLWGKNDVRTAIQQFYTPPPKKKTYTPKTNFWLRPCARPPKCF